MKRQGDYMAQISVIVPVYKVEPYLHRCVDSILGQTFSDFDLILVDDGSPDRCPQICDEYAQRDNRVHVIHQENGGLSAARNAGIDWIFNNTKNEWITFIDSDDWVHEKYLDALYHAVVESKCNISICQAIDVFIKEKDFVINTISFDVLETESFFISDCLHKTIACGKLYNIQCLENIRFPRGKIHEDEFIIHQLLFAEKYVSVTSIPLYYYYQRDESITHAPFSEKKLDAFEARDQQVNYFIKNNYPKAAHYAACLYIMSVCSRYKEVVSTVPRNTVLIKKMAKYVQKARKYSSLLHFGNEKDEWILMLIKPIKTKTKIYLRALLNKITNIFGEKFSL